MKTILLILLTFVNYCTSNQHKSRLITAYNDAAQLTHPIKSTDTADINHQSMPNDHNEKRRLQNEEILWEVGNTRLVSVTDKFQVNNIIANDQIGIGVKVLSGGNAVVYTWIDEPAIITENNALIFKVLDEEGNPLSAETQITPNDQETLFPSPILDIGNNQFMGIWSGDSNAVPAARIYGKAFESNGQPNGNQLLISDENSNFVNLCPDGKCKENICTVTWASVLPYNIYMRELYTNGTTIGNPRLVNVHLNDASTPKVVFFGDGNRLIFWLDSRRNDPKGFDIYAQLIHNNGTRLLEMDLQINEDTVVPFFGNVEADSFKKENRIIMVWEGTSTQEPTPKVYYRNIIYDGEQIILVEPVELPLNPNSNLPNRSPDVVVLINDFYAITWLSFINGGSGDAFVAMQVFESNALAIGIEVDASNGTEVYTGYAPKIDASGNLITVGWQNQENSMDVWARLLKFFTPTKSPTSSPTFLTTFPTTTPTGITKVPTSSPTPSPTTKASAWWQKSKTTFWIVTGSSIFIIVVGIGCYTASRLEAINANTVNTLHTSELQSS